MVLALPQNESECQISYSSLVQTQVFLREHSATCSPSITSRTLVKETGTLTCVDAQLYMYTCERTPPPSSQTVGCNWAWIFPGATDGDGWVAGGGGVKGAGQWMAGARKGSKEMKRDAIITVCLWFNGCFFAVDWTPGAQELHNPAVQTLSFMHVRRILHPAKRCFE